MKKRNTIMNSLNLVQPVRICVPPFASEKKKDYTLYSKSITLLLFFRIKDFTSECMVSLAGYCVR